jgi:amidophosphoribosyltransferase
MELITRRVITELEGVPPTKEIISEYIDPNSEKYNQMVEKIREKLNFTSLAYLRLDDMLESTGVDKEKLCTYCWTGEE